MKLAPQEFDVANSKVHGQLAEEWLTTRVRAAGVVIGIPNYVKNRLLIFIYQTKFLKLSV